MTHRWWRAAGPMVALALLASACAGGDDQGQGIAQSNTETDSGSDTSEPDPDTGDGEPDTTDPDPDTTDTTEPDPDTTDTSDPDTTDPDDSGGSGGSPVPTSVEHIGTVEVGTWPEQLVVTDDSVWVASSGSRSVARVDRASLGPAETISVSRLPVEMETTGGGTMWTIAATDREVWRIDAATNEATSIGRVPDYPVSMTIGSDGSLYVLLWEDNSSIDASVARLATDRSDLLESALLGVDQGTDIIVAGGGVWVGAADGLTLLDPDSLAVTDRFLPGVRIRSMAADDDHLYLNVSIFENGLLDRSSIMVVDLGDHSIDTLSDFGHPVIDLVVDGRVLALVGGNGGIEFIDLDDPVAVHGGFTHDLDTGPAIRDLAIVDGTLYLTHWVDGSQQPGWLSAYELR